MANDFSGDADCVALWRFESGALTTDTIGTNTLINNFGVAENAVDYKEGACSADFESGSTQSFSIIDANLDAGFPLKNGDSNKKISICGWFQMEAVANCAIFSKFDTIDDDRSIMIRVWNSGVFQVYHGYNSGASLETIYLSGAGAIVSGRFYHFAYTYQDSDKAWKLVVWDDTGGSKIINTSGTATNNISIVDEGVLIGARFDNGFATEYFDGEMDEVVVFKDILTTGEIDEIRLGTYGGIEVTVVAGLGVQAEVGTDWPEIVTGLGVEAVVDAEQYVAVSAGIGIEALVITEQYAAIVAEIGIEAEVAVFNWAEWIALYGTRFTARYYFTLTGTPDGVADVVIPISSFQYRLRQATPSYLQVIIPDTSWASYITARPNGEMVVEMAYLVDGVEQHREELARIDLENVRTDEGTTRESITLSGHKTETYVAKIVTVQGITYKSEYNGLLRVRCAAPDMYLRPGDTVNAGAETFTCGQVLVAIGRAKQWMEVVEAT